MNKYRADRVHKDSAKRVPCGTNSIVAIGDNRNTITKQFNKAVPGFDDWNRPNPDYGLMLSEWDEGKREYRILSTKFFC